MKTYALDKNEKIYQKNPDLKKRFEKILVTFARDIFVSLR